MNVISLAVSALALVVATWSAVASHRQAALARSAEHRALMPRLELSVERDPGMGPVLRLRNAGPIDLDELIAHLVRDDSGALRSSPVTGIGKFSNLMEIGEELPLGTLRLGESVLLTMCRNGPWRGGVIRLRCECRYGESVWDALTETELPNDGG